MPERDHDEIRYLRSMAARLRSTADTSETPLAADMLLIARDLERRASEIEQRLPKVPSAWQPVE